MIDIKWIKITTTMFDDEKIKLIEAMPDADTLIVIWVKLICLAGKINSSGYIFLSENIPYSDEQLATIFNRPVNTIRLALAAFEQLEMISVDFNGVVTLLNFEKHQNIEGLAKIKAQTRNRVAAFRERKLLTSQTRNVTVTKSNALDKNRIDKNRIKEIYKEKYGEFQNVRLTAQEHEKLIKRFGQQKAESLIETLSNGIESKGYKYRSHYAAILNWEKRGNGTDRRDTEKEPYRGQPGNKPAGAFSDIE